jgi:hypothetical protein
VTSPADELPFHGIAERAGAGVDGADETVARLAAEVAEDEGIREGVCLAELVDALRGPLADRVAELASRRPQAVASALAGAYWRRIDIALAVADEAEQVAALQAEAERFRAALPPR